MSQARRVKPKAASPQVHHRSGEDQGTAKLRHQDHSRRTSSTSPWRTLWPWSSYHTSARTMRSTLRPMRTPSMEVSTRLSVSQGEGGSGVRCNPKLQAFAANPRPSLNMDQLCKECEDDARTAGHTNDFDKPDKNSYEQLQHHLRHKPLKVTKEPTAAARLPIGMRGNLIPIVPTLKQTL